MAQRLSDRRSPNSGQFLLLPWAGALLMAAVSLLLLLFFSRVFPSTFDVLFQRHVLPPFVFPFGGLNPLPPMDVRTITLVSVIFWGSGLIFSRRCLRSSSGWGPVISRGFLLLAAGLLFFTLTILATIWLLAFLGGNIPPGPWGIYEGNHGPWRHVYDLRKLLGFTLFIPLVSSFCGFISLIVKPGRRAGILFISGILFFYLLMSSLYWLID